jgi:hypothetical protein
MAGDIGLIGLHQVDDVADTGVQEGGDFSRGLSRNPLAGIKHRRCLNADLKAGLELAVSTRALIILEPIPVSFAQNGTRPQRNF